MTRIQLLLTLAIALALTGCQQSSSNSDAWIQQEKISGDIGPLSGSKAAKFKYTLPEGNYDTDIWLEQLDADTSESKRLTFGKSANDGSSVGGTIWVSLSDPATTVSQKGATWKLVISYEESNNADSPAAYGTANYLLKNPLRGLPGGEQDGILMSSKLDQQAIKLREEVTLMTWAGGRPTESVRGGMTNYRHVYLKMKVMPHGEMFAE